MITKFVSELNFARVPSSGWGLGGAFSWPESASAIAQRNIVGQVDNLPPIVNRRLEAVDNFLLFNDFPISATGRLPIVRTLPTCPTRSACSGKKRLRKVDEECLNILEPEPHRYGHAAHCPGRQGQAVV